MEGLDEHLIKNQHELSYVSVIGVSMAYLCIAMNYEAAR